MFKAYFQETVQERWQACFQVRVVTITYFLEDGTMKIVEPSTDNSGLEQGSSLFSISLHVFVQKKFPTRQKNNVFFFYINNKFQVF